MDTPEPDEKSIITYVSQLYDVFPEPPPGHPLFDAGARGGVILRGESKGRPAQRESGQTGEEDKAVVAGRDRLPSSSHRFSLHVHMSS